MMQQVVKLIHTTSNPLLGAMIQLLRLTRAVSAIVTRFFPVHVATMVNVKIILVYNVPVIVIHMARTADGFLLALLVDAMCDLMTVLRKLFSAQRILPCYL